MPNTHRLKYYMFYTLIVTVHNGVEYQVSHLSNSHLRRLPETYGALEKKLVTNALHTYRFIQLTNYILKQLACDIGIPLSESYNFFVMLVINYI